ncbi:MAG: glycosyltransferase family 1 protein [Candidatus Omnitrophota bacterium]
MGRIYFYCCPPRSLTWTAYQHVPICIAEGLKTIGVEFFSNINYWQTVPGQEAYLFRHDPGVTPDDCTVVVLNNYWLDYGNVFPKDLLHSGRKYRTVYLDTADGIRTRSWDPLFRKFDFIFKLSMNTGCYYPSNVHPWAFGLSNRIVKELQDPAPFSKRKKCIMVNYRVRHYFRSIADRVFIDQIQSILPIDRNIDLCDAAPDDPYHYLYWKQSGRHYPNYYGRLKQTAACACFGGYPVPPRPRDQSAPKMPWHSVMNLLDRRQRRIVQWDSWRFWESLSAGCAAFHFDFDKYGFLLPVMPENRKHYFGIDLDAVDDAIRILRSNIGILEKISEEGRRWAIEHYSPEPTARRFLKTIGCEDIR